MIPALPSNASGEARVAEVMAEDRENRFRGGRQSRRDRRFGIDDPDFWQWWHRVGKDEAGGGDLLSREEAEAVYEQWIAQGRPGAK